MLQSSTSELTRVDAGGLSRPKIFRWALLESFRSIPSLHQLSRTCECEKDRLFAAEVRTKIICASQVSRKQCLRKRATGRLARFS